VLEQENLGDVPPLEVDEAAPAEEAARGLVEVQGVVEDL
jgi:hypothetical protein